LQAPFRVLLATSARARYDLGCPPRTHFCTRLVLLVD
jgi:hypothetical protein